MIILAHVTFLKYLGSGPYWPEIIDRLGDSCHKYWWSALLYVQNFVNATDMVINILSGSETGLMGVLVYTTNKFFFCFSA